MRKMLAAVTGIFFLLTAQTGMAAEPSAVLNAAGGGTGGAGFMTLTAVSKIVSDSYKKINISVTPGGYVGNVTRVNNNGIDMAVTASTFAKAGTKGLPPYQKPLKNYRSLFNIQDATWYFAIAPANFPADSLAEVIKKKIPIRIGTIAPGSQTEMLYRNAFELAGANWDDMKAWGCKINFVAWGDSVSLFKDGHLDVILGVTQGKAGWIMELASTRELKFLQWGDEIIKKTCETLGTYPQVMPAGHFQGVNYPVTTIADGQEIVINKNVSANVAYAITKSIAEGAASMRASRANYNFQADKMAVGLEAPIHPGALRYYKEKGYIK